MQMEIVADAIAKALKANGKTKFQTEDHKAALQHVASNSDPDALVENISRIANISAVRQELEKGGIIPSKESDSALIRAVKASSYLAKA